MDTEPWLSSVIELPRYRWQTSKTPVKILPSKPPLNYFDGGFPLLSKLIIATKTLVLTDTKV
jgi:hypothetical protein